MTVRCEDCGCITTRGVCSNCQEELFILENQYDCIDKPMSDGFMKKAGEQKNVIDRRSS